MNRARKFLILLLMLCAILVPQSAFAAAAHLTPNLNSSNEATAYKATYRYVVTKDSVFILSPNWVRLGMVNTGDACHETGDYNYCAIHNGYSFVYVQMDSGANKGVKGWVCLDYLRNTGR